MCKKASVFDFTFPKKSPQGPLHPEDVLFFYYHVGVPNLGSTIVAPDFNEPTKQWLHEKGIEFKPMSELPNDYDWNTSTIYMDKCNGEGDIEAFIRHLRNGFSHYRVTQSGNDFQLEDVYSGESGKASMQGVIDKTLFRELIERIEIQIGEAQEVYTSQQ